MSESRWVSELSWVRPGQQCRSQKTQASVLEAAAILFTEKGVDATSMADVAARAGCSIGSIYHHFRDKKALVYALLDRMREEFRATTRAAVDPGRWEGASIADVLRGYLAFALETARNRPTLERAAIEASRHDPSVRDLWTGLRSELNEGLTGLLLARRHEIGHRDPEVAVAFVLDQIASMTMTRLDAWLLPTSPTAETDEEFIDEVMKSICAYLELAPPGLRPPSLPSG